MKQLLKIFCLFALSLSCKTVFADQPFMSDDPDVLDYKHWQIYVAGVMLKNSFKNEISAPYFEVDYGIHPDMELDLTTPMIYLVNFEYGEQNAYGYTDTEFTYTWRFLKETKYIPEVAFITNLFLPTGNQRRELGNGRYQLQPSLWAQKSWDKLTLYGGGAYAYNPAPNENNFFFGGIVVNYNVTDQIMVGTEIFSSGSADEDTPAFTMFNLGGTLEFKKDVLFLLYGIGHNIAGAENTYAYIGLNAIF